MTTKALVVRLQKTTKALVVRLQKTTKALVVRLQKTTKAFVVRLQKWKDYKHFCSLTQTIFCFYAQTSSVGLTPIH
jgi:hypothetical protein